MRTGWQNRPGVVYNSNDLTRVFAEDMQSISDFQNDFPTDFLKKVYLNIMLAFFKLSVLGGLVKFNLIDGVIDEYEDTSGVDLVNSLNIIYNSVDDYFINSSGIGTFLISRYKLNEYGANTVVSDDIGTNPGVSVRNTSLLHVAGKVGSGAFTLNGTSDTVDLGTGINLTVGLSVFCWVKGNAQTQKQIIGKYETTLSQRCWQLATGLASSNKLLVIISPDGVYNTSKSYESTTVVFDNAWHYVGFTFIANVLKLYIDGVETAVTKLQDPVVNTIYSTSTKTRIGAYQAIGVPAGYFAGSIDEVRIYNNILDADVIADLYNSGTGTEDVTTVVQNFTLISTATIAEQAPAQARIVIFEEDIDSVTLNTDIKAYVSRDGTNYTQITLEDEGDYETGKRILSGLVDITSASGTTIKYKIQTFNSKNLKIHGTALQWD